MSAKISATASSPFAVGRERFERVDVHALVRAVAAKEREEGRILQQQQAARFIAAACGARRSAWRW